VFGHAALAGPFGVIGLGSVLVEQEQHAIGGVFELFRTGTDGKADQVDLELPTGGRVDETRQFVDGLADDLDVFTVDEPVGLGHRGGGQRRRQGRPGHRLPRRQQGGFGQPAIGLAGRDPPADREHLFPRFGAHLLRGGLGLQAGQQAVTHPGQLTPQRFKVIKGRNEI
jgi:hypothetical protein